MRQFEPGTHHGLMLLRLKVPGRKALGDRVRLLFQTEDVESWARCLVIVTPRKTRVRRPPPNNEAPSDTPI